MRSIVVHYKELALKGRNRPWFVQVLTRNLKQALKGLDVSSVRSVMGRVEIDLGPAASYEEARERIRHVFGIANFSQAGTASHDDIVDVTVVEGAIRRHDAIPPRRRSNR